MTTIIPGVIIAVILTILNVLFFKKCPEKEKRALDF